MGNFIFLKEIVEFWGKQPVRAHFIFFFSVRMGNLLNTSKHTTSCDLNRKCRRTGEEHSLAFDCARLACFLCKAVSPHQTGFQWYSFSSLKVIARFPLPLRKLRTRIVRLSGRWSVQIMFFPPISIFQRIPAANPGPSPSGNTQHEAGSHWTALCWRCQAFPDPAVCS